MGFVVYAFALAIPATIYSAFVAGYLWLWFITPITGVSAPGIWALAGLMLTVRFAFNRHVVLEQSNRDKFETGVFIAAYSIIAPSAAFIGGWLLHIIGATP